MLKTLINKCQQLSLSCQYNCARSPMMDAAMQQYKKKKTNKDEINKDKTNLPKYNKVLHARKCDVDTVHECVAQEEDEIFVVVEGHAVVDPRAVVVHLKYARSAHTAMVCTIGFHMNAAIAVSYRTGYSSGREYIL